MIGLKVLKFLENIFKKKNLINFPNFPLKKKILNKNTHLVVIKSLKPHSEPKMSLKILLAGQRVLRKNVDAL